MDKQENKVLSSEMLGIINKEKAKSDKYRRSILTQDILSQKRNFTNDWALLIVVAIIGILFLGASFIRFPNYIVSNAVIVATNLPSPVIAGHRDTYHLMVRNSAFVTKGEILAVVPGQGDYTQVLKLEKLLRSRRKPNELMPILEATKMNFNCLGKIQALFDNMFSKPTGISGRNTHQLMVAVSSWIDEYTLRSSSDGRLYWDVATLKSILSFQESTTVAHIVPRSAYYLRLALDQNQLGRVHIGQAVQVRVKTSSGADKSISNGSINNISEVMDQGKFDVFVSLPKGHRNFSQGAWLKSGLKCRAYIIVQNQNLLQALFNAIFNRPKSD
ncbi:HlyD family secretion protein [Mucilaginibacter sp. CSA2-8R]|uniref:HlyD family secretion protein n=1 Tax=Mucilaginibacter sp. CSA2-8R TaxID=3141542 RepID=UPI00315E003B